MRLLAIDLYSGLGGWAEGFLAEGYDVIGFDVERHQYGDQKYPAQLVLQDVLTLDGWQFRDATVIVASPPCQAYSYRAMPWKRAKALPPPDNSLFEACFRIQREASESAGRHIPLVVENVRGAQRWVGRARWNYGSYYLWGDIPALMVSARQAQKFNPDGTEHPQGSCFKIADSKNRGSGRKLPGFNFHEHEKTGKPGRSFQSAAVKAQADGLGGYGGNFGWDGSPMRRGNSHSSGRKAASAMIAKIPFDLANHIARCFKPTSVPTTPARTSMAVLNGSAAQNTMAAERDEAPNQKSGKGEL